MKSKIGKKSLSSDLEKFRKQVCKLPDGAFDGHTEFSRLTGFMPRKFRKLTESRGMYLKKLIELREAPPCRRGASLLRRGLCGFHSAQGSWHGWSEKDGAGNTRNR